MRFFKTPIFLGVILLLCALPCAAQYQGGPGGDYVQTCRDIRTHGNTLDAVCQTRDGDWRRTSLHDIDQCNSGISNDDGHLVCGRGGYGYGYGNPSGNYQGNYEGGLPRGDYVQTCRKERMHGSRLDAECQKRDGHWRKTSLDDADQCPGGILNDDGHLRCGTGGYGYNNGRYNNGYDNGYDGGYRGGYQGNAPAGSYTQTCRNIRTDGNRLEAECQTRDGDWRRTSLNDIDRCTSAIANDDGHLVCPRQ